MTTTATTRPMSTRAAVRHARNADASWATADALYTLAKQAEELAASENGAGPLSDEARRLFRAADEYQADGDAQDDDPFVALAITSALDGLIALARVEHLIPDAVWAAAVDQRATAVAALVIRPDLVDGVADWLVDVATDLAIEDNPR